MYNIDKPQERRKATGTGGIPPENIRLRRTLTTEYLQLSLCYGVRDRMSIETAGFTGLAVKLPAFYGGWRSRKQRHARAQRKCAGVQRIEPGP